MGEKKYRIQAKGLRENILLNVIIWVCEGCENLDKGVNEEPCLSCIDYSILCKNFKKGE
jgi:hypothetical protein